MCFATMARYIARKCPRCGDDFWVVVNETRHSKGERPINEYCGLCGHRLDGWRSVVRRKRPSNPDLGNDVVTGLRGS